MYSYCVIDIELSKQIDSHKGTERNYSKRNRIRLFAAVIEKNNT